MASHPLKEKLPIIENAISNDINTSVLNDGVNQPANFETAITATKFGKFNVILFLISIPAAWSFIFEVSTMSYVFPAAQCDLDLSLQQKGSLNAITFLGMVSTGFFWGFLCDTLGRKKLITIGLLLDGIFVVISSISQNYITLLIAKFFGGFVINGPHAALTAYLSEFHSAKYRVKIQLGRGLILSCGNIALALLGWAILPTNIQWNVFKNSLVIHSWNVYLLLCAMPSLISGVIFIFMPESPKFLMTMGRNGEALLIFQKIFSANSGLNREDFPITTLIDETELNDENMGVHITAKRNTVQALKEGVNQIKPLFSSPLVKYFILVSAFQICVMFGLNCIRFWLPQIFQSISDYQFLNNGSTTDLCTMLETIRPTPSNSAKKCFVNLSPSVYQNTMITSSVGVLAYLATGTFVNKIGKKPILVGTSFLSGFCVVLIYFARDTTTTVILSSAYLPLGNLSGIMLLSIVIDLFPTHLRAVTISLVMLFGTASSLIGNMIFPVLLSLGCAPTFISTGIVVVCGSLFALLLPRNEMKPLL